MNPNVKYGLQVIMISQFTDGNKRSTVVQVFLVREAGEGLVKMGVDRNSLFLLSFAADWKLL